MKVMEKRLLILCKTYPSPSKKYTETSCVAAMTEEGELIRIFPVPFRLLDEKEKFKKWQWITAKIQKAKGDHRPESYQIYTDSIKFHGEPISTKNDWKDRYYWLKKLTIFSDFSELELYRESYGNTLGLLKPSKLTELSIEPVANPNWTEDELQKLSQAQGELFSPQDREIRQLEKLGHSFYYHYTCQHLEKVYKHKIVDWEAGALYRRLHKKSDWEAKFRVRYQDEFFHQKEIFFLMGTIHRFPDQWLIISVLYPPKLPDEATAQQSLF